ncbi:MAG: hypothetical protein HUJ25_07430 [Crocinitomicaceae bacterium]|nr:hypothetical protein [Crocinitomicaceae bacterium]
MEKKPKKKPNPATPYIVAGTAGIYVLVMIILYGPKKRLNYGSINDVFSAESLEAPWDVLAYIISIIVAGFTFFLTYNYVNRNRDDIDDIE